VFIVDDIDRYAAVPHARFVDMSELSMICLYDWCMFSNLSVFECTIGLNASFAARKQQQFC